MRKNATIVFRILAILGILAGIYSQCTAQNVEEIGTYPVTETNAVTLKEDAIYPVYRTEKPLNQRLEITYVPVTEKSDWSLKKSLIRAIVPTVWAGASGAVGSITQVNLFKQDALFKKFPNLDPVYWDRNQSWNNKKVFGAARDSYHDLYKVHSWGCGLVGASIAVPIFENRHKQKAWQTAVDVGVMLLCSFTSYQIVSQAVYNYF